MSRSRGSRGISRLWLRDALPPRPTASGNHLATGRTNGRLQDLSRLAQQRVHENLVGWFDQVQIQGQFQ